MGRTRQHQATSVQPSTMGTGRGRLSRRSSAHMTSTVRIGTRGKTRASGLGTRGRGRGAARSTANTNASPLEDNDDEADSLCLQALCNIELLTNDFSKAFMELNQQRELPGFDKISGDFWIYPTNYPVRDYQFNIVSTALYHNTMVCLPTGLGKTFIAAVVMYNFHRWYPNNLIIFMAPTRPLVKQQLDACYELMGIDPSKMVELTGQISPKCREELWKEKKVFFLTPQVMESDLTRGSCLAENVRCIVTDEAHKALGNYAYAQVIRMLLKKNQCFRVLALSATPGNDLKAVEKVLANLLISKVELRSETSLDILPYTHQKQVETIVVPLDEHINIVHDQILGIFQTFSGKLMKAGALTGSASSSLSRFQLLKARDAYRQRQKTGVPNYQKAYNEVDFGTCISLAHAIDLLLVHGLRSFYSFLRALLNKEKGTPAVAAQLAKSTNLESILEHVREKLNISAENSFFDLNSSGLFTTFSKRPASDVLSETISENSDDYVLSHPKMRVLKDLVENHFQTHPNGTRIIIFSEYRDSVQEIGNMLNSLRPIVKPMIFLGQANGAGVSGRGLRQKEQLRVVESFRSGEFNVIVSTCVGEEGLDIGEVDLIICYDASSSPTRLVQRMGRTGRRREGKTIFLLTAGKECGLYYNSVNKQHRISKTITDAGLLDQFLYKETPRMIPYGIVPKCFKMNIVSSSEQEQLQKNNENESEIEDMDIRDDTEEATRRKNDSPRKRSVLRKKSSRSNSTTKNSEGLPLASYKKVREKNPNKCRKDLKSDDEAQTKQNSDSIRTGSEQTNPAANMDLDNDDPEVFDLFDAENHLNVSFTQLDSELHSVGTDYQTHLKEVIGVKDIEAGGVAKCVFVPKLGIPDGEIPELPLDHLEDVFGDINVERLREQLNSIYFLGSNSGRCDCGIFLVDSDKDFHDSHLVSHTTPSFCNEHHRSKSKLEKVDNPTPTPPAESDEPLKKPDLSEKTKAEFDHLKPYLAEVATPIPSPSAKSGEPLQTPEVLEKEKAELDNFNLVFEAAFLEAQGTLDFCSPKASELEQEEPSPIFKRRRLTRSTPTFYKFDDLETKSNVATSGNMKSRNALLNPGSPRSVNSSPSSPDMFPASPVSPKRIRSRAPRRYNGNPISGVSPDFISGQQLVVTPIPPPRKELFPKLPLPSAKDPSGSPPSSDTTFYESSCSPDERRQSPIIAKTVKPASEHPKTKTFSFRHKNVLDVDDTNDLKVTVELQDIENLETNSPGVGAQSQPISPDLLLSQVSASASESAKKVFSFRRPSELRSIPVIPFAELLSPKLSDEGEIEKLLQLEVSSQELNVEALRRTQGRKSETAGVNCDVFTQLAPEVRMPSTSTKSWFNTSHSFKSRPLKSAKISPKIHEGVKAKPGCGSDDSDDEFFIPRNSGTQRPFLGSALSTRVGNEVSSERVETPEIIHRNIQSKVTVPQCRKTGTKTSTSKKRKRVGSRFVLNEADVEGDDGSSDDSELDDLDAYDESFVDVEESPPITTETQQVRYLQSTKVTPSRMLHNKKSLYEVALERIERTNDPDEYLDDYQIEEGETGMFCVPNDYIEYETTGDFTQRMDEARLALQLESPSGGPKKNLRSKARQQERQSEEFKAPKLRQRKRIIILSSDSD